MVNWFCLWGAVWSPAALLVHPLEATLFRFLLRCKQDGPKARTCCSSTFCNLTWAFQVSRLETSLTAAARPTPLPWRLLVHSFLFPSTGSPGPSDGTGARLGGSPTCPGLQRAPMNTEAPTKLAVGRVRFFGEHLGEVSSCGSPGLGGVSLGPS